MVTFQVNDMTCGHCASAISRAVAAVDKDARLEVRIQQKLVRVSSTASAAQLAQAIQDAGYSPQEVQEAPLQPAAPPASGGCGCGCGSRKVAGADARQEASAAAGSCCSCGMSLKQRLEAGKRSTPCNGKTRPMGSTVPGTSTTIMARP